jgi:hypothetical protein
MKDLLDQFFESYESDIADYNVSVEKLKDNNNSLEKKFPEIDSAIIKYLKTGNAAELADELINNLGIEYIAKEEFPEIPREANQAKEYLTAKIKNIFPGMLDIFKDIVNNKTIGIIRYIYVDDFKNVNFSKPGRFWTALKYKDYSWYEEHVADNEENLYMELIAKVPGSACSLSNSLFYAMEYSVADEELREYEVNVKDQSKIKIYSARFKDNFEYVV